MFGTKLLESVHSEYSGDIRVMHGWGHTYLATGILTQSGDIVREVWEPVLKKINQPQKSWLIVGLAGGTIAGLISRKYHPAKIIGVEIDPVMIDLGKKYFKLDQISELEIVNADAYSHILYLKSKVDYILVDLYFGDQLPPFVYDQKFINKLRTVGRTVIFNHLFYDQAKKQAAENLVSRLKDIFPSVTLTRRLTNLLIVCT